MIWRHGLPYPRTNSPSTHFSHGAKVIKAISPASGARHPYAINRPPP